MNSAALAPFPYRCVRRSDHPRVSVITIFLNAERFMVEAIESVLAQNFRNFELILVDDGSTEGSSAIARDYTQRYPSMIRYLEHEGHENRGMSASRNLGLSVAQGEFVTFIDADDVWQPTKLTEQIAIMDAHPSLGMVCGATRYWYSWEGGEDVIIPTGHIANVVVPPPEAAVTLYPLGKAAAPCDPLMQRDLVTKLGGFEEHFTGMYEDQAFLIKLYLAAPVYFSDRVWLNYRQHADSCVAKATHESRYHEVRQYFLNWLEHYLAVMPQQDESVVMALHRALWRYRHPLMHATLHLASGMMQKVRRIGHPHQRTATGLEEMGS